MNMVKKYYSEIILRRVITPIAVPFFFATSGFFLYLSSDPRKHIVKIIKSYLVWIAIYFPFVMVNWVLGSESLEENLFNYIRRFIFEGSYQTIWFLNALWFASAIMCLLLKFFKPMVVFFISVPWYIVSCLLSSWRSYFLNLVRYCKAVETIPISHLYILKPQKEFL